MENFEKSKFAIVNGAIVAGASLVERSLVLLNAKNMAMYQVVSKCRNYDTLSVCKALAKAVLAAKRVEFEKNSTEDAKHSGRRVVNPMSAALSSQYVAVVDNQKRIVPQSVLTVEGGQTLRTQFRFTESQPIYKLVVLQGRPWDDKAVIDELNCWCRTAIAQWHAVEEFDAAIGAAADSNEAEAEALEKAAAKTKREAAKAAEKAEVEKTETVEA